MARLVLGDARRAPGSARLPPRYKRGRHVEAAAYSALADGVLERIGDHSDVAFFVRFGQASWLGQQGDFAAAVWHELADLGHALHAGGWHSIAVSVALADIAESQRDLGDYAAAGRTAEAATRVVEAVVGPDHPVVGDRVYVVGSVVLAAGDLDVADRAFTRVLAIYEKSFGPTNERLAAVVTDLGYLHLQQGRLDEAKALGRRARAILLPLGPDWPYRVTVEMYLGETELHLGELEAARTGLEQALELGQRLDGRNDMQAAHILEVLGETAMEAGHPAEARARFEESIAKIARQAGPDHPLIPVTRVELAGALTGLGKPAEARALCRAALPAVVGAFGDADAMTVQSRDLCAVADAAAGQREEALALAEAAQRSADAPSSTASSRADTAVPSERCSRFASSAARLITMRAGIRREPGRPAAQARACARPARRCAPRGASRW